MRECDDYRVKSTTSTGTIGIVTMKIDPKICFVVSVSDLKDILGAIEITNEQTIVLSMYESNTAGILGIHVPLESDVKGTIPLFVLTGRIVCIPNSVESQIRFCDIIEKEMEMLECKPKEDSS